jgi:hypothetical protein
MWWANSWRFSPFQGTTSINISYSWCQTNQWGSHSPCCCIRCWIACTAPADNTGWRKRRRAYADWISGNEILCRTQTEKKECRMVSFACSGEKNVEHRKQLWFGRVELFFRCSFQSAASGRVFDLDLALLSLYDNHTPCPLESVMKTGRFKTSRQSEMRASERHCAGQTCAHSR